MSGVKTSLGDGNMKDTKSLYDEDDSDFVGDSWEDVIMMRIGPYNLEYDPHTKELTVTGHLIMEADCIGIPDSVHGAVGETVAVTSVVFHYDE